MDPYDVSYLDEAPMWFPGVEQESFNLDGLPVLGGGPEEASRMGLGQTSKRSVDDEDTESNGTSSGKDKESKVSRRERNTIACRRHREKRRREMESLRKKNEELEKEQDLFLARIADLTCEVETLRAGGTVDLEKENSLLQAEIKKYRRFIHEVASSAKLIPQKTAEEQYRLLTSGIDSSNGQVLGLFYCSIGWQHISNEFNIRPTVGCKVTYEYLPKGVPTNRIKRIGVRNDFTNIPLSAKEVFDRIWTIHASEENLQNVARIQSTIDGVPREVRKMVLPDQLKEVADSLDDEFHLYEYIEGKDQKKAHFACTSKIQDVHPMIFGDQDRQGTVKAYVIAAVTTTHVDFADEASKLGNFFTGYIIEEGENENECRYAKVLSYPRTEGSFHGFDTNDPLPICAEGNLAQHHVESCKLFVNLMIENSSNLISFENSTTATTTSPVTTSESIDFSSHMIPFEELD